MHYDKLSALIVINHIGTSFSGVARNLVALETIIIDADALFNTMKFNYNKNIDY